MNPVFEKISVPALPVATSDNRLGDYLELTKPRLSFLSVMTAVVGYFSARTSFEPAVFFPLLVGTSFAAGGVAALNQWMESDTDALMRRTADRPIPAGRVTTGSAFVIGWGLCAAGLAVLFAKVNGLATGLALATVVSYLALYTPAKRWSRYSTEIGAVAGAFPPLIGWAAAREHNPGLGWALFGILFFWQIPHFMAIAWTYREDYQNAGFPTLAVRDPGGRKVALWSLANALAAVAVSASPFFLGLNSAGYLAATIILGVWFVCKALAFVLAAERKLHARRLFFTSIVWLPLQLAALVADRWLFN